MLLSSVSSYTLTSSNFPPPSSSAVTSQLVLNIESSFAARCLAPVILALRLGRTPSYSRGRELSSIGLVLLIRMTAVALQGQPPERSKSKPVSLFAPQNDVHRSRIFFDVPVSPMVRIRIRLPLRWSLPRRTHGVRSGGLDPVKPG